MSQILTNPVRLLLVNRVLSLREIATSSIKMIKEIRCKEDENSLVIDAIIKPSPKDGNLLKEAHSEKFCPECTLGLDIKHTDVLILSQYLRSDGCMLPKRITGLCRRQQIKIGKLVTMAQKAGLMPNLAPAWGKRDPKKRYGWKKFNKYFDEKTIKI